MSADLGVVGLVLFAVVVFYAIRAAVIMRKRGESLWLALLLISLPGVLTLSWTYEKYPWLVLSMVVAAAAARNPAPAGRNRAENEVAEPVETQAAWLGRRYGRAAHRPVRARWER